MPSTLCNIVYAEHTDDRQYIFDWLSVLFYSQLLETYSATQQYVSAKIKNFPCRSWHESTAVFRILCFHRKHDKPFCASCSSIMIVFSCYSPRLESSEVTSCFSQQATLYYILLFSQIEGQISFLSCQGLVEYGAFLRIVYT